MALESNQEFQTRTSGWGHPVGIRAAADWHLCPPLALPSGKSMTH